MKNKQYDGGRLHCLCNEVDPYTLYFYVYGLLDSYQTTVESHMEHTCGIIIEDLKQKDAGTWQCILHYENEDTGQTEEEIQKFTFTVAKTPSTGSGQLCSCRGRETDNGEMQM